MPQTFTMKATHMEAFAQQQQQRFEDEMVVHLRQEYSSTRATWNEADLRALIRHGILTARGYNILLEPDVARYIELMVIIGPEFDRSDDTPWAREILTQPYLSGAAKMKLIDEHPMFTPPEAEPGTPQAIRPAGGSR